MMLLWSQGVADPTVMSSSDDADEEGEPDWTTLPLYSTESQDGVLVHDLLDPTANALSIVDAMEWDASADDLEDPVSGSDSDISNADGNEPPIDFAMDNEGDDS